MGKLLKKIPPLRGRGSLPGDGRGLLLFFGPGAPAGALLHRMGHRRGKKRPKPEKGGGRMKSEIAVLGRDERTRAAGAWLAAQGWPVAGPEEIGRAHV